VREVVAACGRARGETEDRGDPRERGGEARHETRRDALLRSGCCARPLSFVCRFRLYGGRAHVSKWPNGPFGWVPFFFSAGKTDMPLRRPGDNVSVFGLPVGACDGFGKPYGVGMAVYLNFRGNSG
jgi:hypothetical protein